MKRLSFLRDAGLDLLTLGILFIVLLPILWVFLASVRPLGLTASWSPYPGTEELLSN
jgi:ABC-type glycerol-3-phosphate transport system permease component